MFFSRKIESEEYKRLSFAIMDLERKMKMLEASQEALDAGFKSLRGRFYQMKQIEETEEPKTSYSLNPFK